MELSIGQGAETAVNFIVEYYGESLGEISENSEALLEQFLENVQLIPPWLIIALWIVAVLIFKRKWGLAFFGGIGLWAIESMGLWQEMLQTLLLVGLSTLVSVLLGIPLGILAAKKKGLYAFLQPLLDLMQTIPTFVYLIPTLMIFGLGVIPGVVSTVIFALPAPIRLTYLGMTSVPRNLQELAESFGATPWQLLWKTEIPHAAPMIITGISQCIMLSLSMVVMAALVGANGLGRPVVQALNTVNIVKGFEAGLSIVIVAILLDRLLRRDPPQAQIKNKRPVLSFTWIKEKWPRSLSRSAHETTSH